MSFIKQSFEKICNEAIQCNNIYYLCLMERIPIYGGPEEGGWWTSDNILHSYQEFSSEELAQKVKDQVDKLSLELTKLSQDEYGEHCLQTCEWLENRGLDASFLPEPDGPSEFYAIITNEIPQNHYGNRHYS